MQLTDEMVKECAQIVGIYVAQFDKRTPSHIERDDIKGAAYIGLLEAAEKYDRSYETKFSTFAGHRVKGAILDYLRSLDWVPREVRKAEKILASAHRTAAQDAGAKPDEQDVAELAGVGIEEYWKVETATAQRMYSFDAGWSADAEETTLSDVVGDAGAVNPERQADARRFLERALAGLSESERAVVTGTHLAGYTLREIANELGVTESRACQLRTSAREKMQRIAA